MHVTIPRSIAVVVLSLCGAAMSVAPGCSRSPSADVRPDYAAERSTTYELTTMTQLNHAVMITGEKASIDELAVRFRVETVSVAPDGGALIALQVERLSYNNAGESMLPVRFDSERGDDLNEPATLGPLFRELSGLRIELRLAPDGSATCLDGFSGVEEMVAARPDRDQLGPLFRPRWWEDLAKSVFRLGSDKPRIGVGDTWKEDSMFAEPGYMTLSGLLERRVVSVTASRSRSPAGSRLIFPRTRSRRWRKPRSISRTSPGGWSGTCVTAGSWRSDGTWCCN